MELGTDLRTVAHPERVAAAMAHVVGTADRARRRRGLPAAHVLVRAPGLEFSSGDRAGLFHAASVGKAMTAVLAFRLAEAGRLDLDAPITSLLSRGEWRGLFVRDGRDFAAAVTPRHLLSHTSGAADYFLGRTRGAPPFERLLAEEPDTRWTPDDLLAFSRDHQRPVAEPGRRFSYSDTGYVLLARVIEEAGQARLGTQLHAGVFEPAGMSSSFLLFHTLPGGAPATSAPADHPDIAPLWLGGFEASRTQSLSCDWGGGGVVTTVDDLDRFTRALGEGFLVKPSSLAQMRRPLHRFRPGIHCGAGLMELRYGGFSPFLRTLPRLIGHLGVTGVHAFTAPELGLRIAMNFHSTREMVRSFRVHIRLVQLVAAALEG